MSTKKKVSKKLKVVKEGPKKLTVSEVLSLEETLQEVALAKKDTTRFKLNIDVEVLKKRIVEQDAQLQSAKVEQAKTDLKMHGATVMNLEKKFTNLRDKLCEKYGVKELSYDPDTLVISKGE